MALRNLMYNAYQRDLKGEPHPVAAPPTPQPAPRKQQPPPPPPPQHRKKPSPAAVSQESAELQQLLSLRQQGILTQEEFESAKKRLLAKA